LHECRSRCRSLFRRPGKLRLDGQKHGRGVDRDCDGRKAAGADRQLAAGDENEQARGSTDRTMSCAEARRQLEKYGLLLLQDKKLPNVVGVFSAKPLKT